jgi:hypothetical protein
MNLRLELVKNNLGKIASEYRFTHVCVAGNSGNQAFPEMPGIPATA